MASKKKNDGKIVKLGNLDTDIVDGEIIEKSSSESESSPAQSLDNVVKTNIQQTLAAQEQTAQGVRSEEQLQTILTGILKTHQEKGALAVDLLKSVLSQKVETVLHGAANFENLIKQVYSLADAFKVEMDRRYSDDVNEATNKFYGRVATDVKSAEDKSKNLN